ncbi:hypothetical protein M434DRAFT_12159 [Hypoxylon sp. CO27-5]|nr:hypothetical protein M434DRAFT_12159 [Hypoxylon sp. CO27-5]
MKPLSILSVLLASSGLATAEGVISFFQEYNCQGLYVAQVYDPPANGEGECVEHHYRSATANYSDPGYIYELSLKLKTRTLDADLQFLIVTVYLDYDCFGRKVPLRPGLCHNDRFKTFSYDHGS